MSGHRDQAAAQTWFILLDPRSANVLGEYDTRAEAEAARREYDDDGLLIDEVEYGS